MRTTTAAAIACPSNDANNFEQNILMVTASAKVHTKAYTGGDDSFQQLSSGSPKDSLAGRDEMSRVGLGDVMRWSTVLMGWRGQDRDVLGDRP